MTLDALAERRRVRLGKAGDTQGVDRIAVERRLMHPDCRAIERRGEFGVEPPGVEPGFRLGFWRGELNRPIARLGGRCQINRFRGRRPGAPRAPKIERKTCVTGCVTAASGACGVVGVAGDKAVAACGAGSAGAGGATMEAAAGNGGRLPGSASAPGAVASALATTSRAEDLRKGFTGKSGLAVGGGSTAAVSGRDFNASLACGALPEPAEARGPVALGVASGSEAAGTRLGTGDWEVAGEGAATGAATTGALTVAAGAGSAEACVAGCCGSPPAGADARAGVPNLSPSETGASGSARRSTDAVVSAGAASATALSGVALAMTEAAMMSWLGCDAGARSGALAKERAFTRPGAAVVSPKPVVRPKPAAISSPAPATAIAAALGVGT